MMGNYGEERFLERVKELLNYAAEDLDSRTRQRLEHIRMKALSGVDEWLERLFEDIQRRM
jgi:L-lactate utilization protein LutB